MADTIGNKNQLGVINPRSTNMLGPNRPGAVTRGPGSNKPRIHLVSSKGKIPAEVYAQAVGARQRAQQERAKTLSKTRLPGNNLMADGAHAPNGPSETETKTDGMVGSKTGGNPQVYKHQLSNPSGVAKRTAPKHQNNPALAGRFTPQGRKYN
jgi:hypothetical protein